MPRSIIGFGACVAIGALLGFSWEQQPTPGAPGFFDLLQTRIGAGGEALATLAAGRPLAMLLPEAQPGEVGVAGAERLAVPLNFFLDSFRKMPVFKRGQQVLESHELSNPPSLSDFESLRLLPAEVRAIPNCTPGHCALKLSASMMEQLRSGEGASSESHFRELMFQFASQYLKEGDPAMIDYADKLPPISSLDAFHVLLQEFGWLKGAAPPLYDCLGSFSGGMCPQIDSFLYWSSARFGLKPVFSITHVMIYHTAQDGRPWVFIAFKQIYADHYFDGSLGLAVLDEQSPGPMDLSLWILYVNRSLTDALGGWLGLLKRSVTQKRTRAALQRNLEELKQNFERRYAVAAAFPNAAATP